MKIYTKTGDRGETGLIGGSRVRKDDPRIETYGTVDELNSALGLARAQQLPAAVDALLDRIQNELFSLGAELATVTRTAPTALLVGQQQIDALEQAIDQFEAALEPLRNFILPGGSPGAAALHLARTICRRAERRVVTLTGNGAAVDDKIVIYLNRLSDLLFVLGRSVNSAAGQPDVIWRKPDSTA